MFFNFLKISFRNLLKNKRYTFINVIGLAIGLSSCMLIGFWVKYELSYDRFHEHSDRIYRVNCKVENEDKPLSIAPSPVARTLREDFPEVEAAGQIRAAGDFMVKSDYSDRIHETKIAEVEPDVFKMFSFPFLSGSPSDLFSVENGVVINERLAKKYFGNRPVIGETLEFIDTWEDTSRYYMVVGVMEDMPANSHFQYDAFFKLTEQDPDNWLRLNTNAYVLLREGKFSVELAQKFPAMLERKAGPQYEDLKKKSYFRGDTTQSISATRKLLLQPITEIHLNPAGWEQDESKNGSLLTVYLFSGIALFILLLACINFVNLTTARSTDRAKEVGIRKVMGAYRSQLVWQFLIDAVLLCLAGVISANIFVELSLPIFNETVQTFIHLPLYDWRFYCSMILLAVLLGGVAGLYPALYLSSYEPVSTLKGSIWSGLKGKTFRNGLVIFQFSISILLMCFTLGFFKQLLFIKNKELGFEQKNTIAIYTGYQIKGKEAAFKQEVLKIPSVVSMSHVGASPLPKRGNRNRIDFLVGKDEEIKETKRVECWTVDEQFINSIGLNLLEGESFVHSALEYSVILNEKALKYLQIEGPAIGKVLPVEKRDKMVVNYHIIGVVEDFHYQSLHQEIKPLAFVQGLDPNTCIIKTSTNDYPTLIAQLQEVWTQYAPNKPFEYIFMEDGIDQLYNSEDRLGRIIGVFSFLAILVACLGLFALSAFMVEKRLKEVGIRKVIGASGWDILRLFSKQLLSSVGIAVLIALPIAGYLLNEWLQNYAYRIELGVSLFFGVAFLAIGIAFLTIFFQIRRVSQVEPAKILRYE